VFVIAGQQREARLRAKRMDARIKSAHDTGVYGNAGETKSKDFPMALE
jgi:hypothetical protein